MFQSLIDKNNPPCHSPVLQSPCKLMASLHINVPENKANISNPMSSPTGTISAANSCHTSPRRSSHQRNLGNDVQITTVHDILASSEEKKLKVEAAPATNSICQPSGPQVSLVTKLDGRDDQKPPYSYVQLIAQALSSAPDKQLYLNEIYSYISKHYPFYRITDRGWQNSVRHNLSLNQHFVKVPRLQESPGKGGFWKIDSQSESKMIEKAFCSKRKKLVLSSRSVPASPSHSGVRELVISNSSSCEPSPVLSDNIADLVSDSVSQASPTIITQPCYIRLTRDIQDTQTAPASPNKSSAEKHRKNLKRKALEMEAKSSLSSQSSSNFPTYSYSHNLEIPSNCGNPFSVPEHCPDDSSISHIPFVGIEIKSRYSKKNVFESMLQNAGNTTERVKNRSSDKDKSQICLQKEAESKELIIVDVCSLNPHQFSNIQSSNVDNIQNSPFETVAAHVSHKFQGDPFHWNVEGNASMGVCLSSETDCLSINQKQPVNQHRLQRFTENDSQILSKDKFISPSHEIVPHPEFSFVEISGKLSPPELSSSFNAFFKGSSSVAEELYEIDIKKNAGEESNQISNEDKSPSQGIEILKDSNMFVNSPSTYKDDIDNSDYYQHLSTLDYCYFASTYSQLKASWIKKMRVQENLNNHLYENSSTSKISTDPQLKPQKSIIESEMAIVKHSPEIEQGNIIINQPFLESSHESASAPIQNSLETGMFQDYFLCSTEKFNINKLTESLQNSNQNLYYSAPPENNLKHIGNKCFTPSPAAVFDKYTQPHRSETSQAFTNMANRAPSFRLSDLLENIFKSNHNESSVPCSSKNLQGYSEGVDKVYSSNEAPMIFPDATSSLSSHNNSFNHKFINQVNFEEGIKYFKNLLVETKFNFDRECTNILQHLENFLADTISLKSPEIGNLNFIDPIYDRYLSNRGRTERDFVKSMLLFSGKRPKFVSTSKDCHQFEKSLRDKWQRFNEYQKSVSDCNLKNINIDSLYATTPDF